MNEQQRKILAVASRVVGYPEDTFSSERQILLQAIHEEVEQEELKHKLVQALEPLYALSLQELQEQYVQTFDWKEKTGLYLTAHELGDSRDRGAALILLQHIIADAGYEPAAGELADYIPALYELIAVAPDNVHLKALQRRLAVATNRIAGLLSEEHPYAPIFHMVLDDVLGKPSAEDIQKLDQSREQTDLEDMPYPILYGMDGMAKTDNAPLPHMKMCK
ncbi:nitrate reductase molybdenum cofactor assembly chaperone [Paenibacillus selenitireducens]|uniref:Nitrate reductase molybdenum cofactor assembly chaperone n=1 Tax=Paenibacillus selenitireducens TaxID=1324314 RepID=A0A1T2X0E8_9BACL|nr:nitrate reductase molybdenum cofactor assembly chaperone [Paenibacillus selenitireducens]OPA73332.1 nitrate reductase molybdenum cofactor assembly chaperone [Paenibacillus selenitireducens]